MSNEKSIVDFYPTRIGSECKVLPRTDPVVYPSSLSEISEEQKQFWIFLWVKLKFPIQ